MPLLSLLLSLSLLPVINSEINFLLQYPVKLLPPVTGNSFSGNLTTSDGFYCFGNQDYHPPTYLESLWCLTNLNRFLSPSRSSSCHSLWGSRSVSISVIGSVEFVQTIQLPRESLQMLNVTYWLHLNSDLTHHHHHSPTLTNNSLQSPTGMTNSHEKLHELIRQEEEELQEVNEIKLIDAAPFYLCARNNHWQKFIDARFSLRLRPAFIRVRSKAICLRKLVFGGLYLFGLSISWLSPILKTSWVTYYAFMNGLHIFILLVTISIVTLLSTPFILTKQNRSYVRHAYRLFFSTVKVLSSSLFPLSDTDDPSVTWSGIRWVRSWLSESVAGLSCFLFRLCSHLYWLLSDLCQFCLLWIQPRTSK